MATSPRTSFHRVFLRIIRLFLSVCLCPCWSKRIFDLSHHFFCLPCVSFHIIVLYLQRNRGQSAIMNTENLDFITFCVGSLSDALGKSASQVYGALRSSGVLNDYILPCYDTLHTFSKDYLVEELTEVLKERGALA